MPKRIDTRPTTLGLFYLHLHERYRRGWEVDMHFFKSMIGCILLLLLVCGVTFSQERRQYGRQWQQLNLSERTLYLSGLQEGVYYVMTFAMHITGALPYEDQFKELNLDQTQKDKVNILMEKHLKKMDISSLGTGVVADVMVNLYKDPANTFIPWFDMAEVAVMRLQGKPKDDIGRSLEILRQTVDRIYEKKKEHSHE